MDLLSFRCRKAHASRDSLFLAFCFVFLPPDFHKMWHSVMSICLFIEDKLHWVSYISSRMGDRFSALLYSLMALRLMLVDQNPFQPCFYFVFHITPSSFVLVIL